MPGLLRIAAGPIEGEEIAMGRIEGRGLGPGGDLGHPPREGQEPSPNRSHVSDEGRPFAAEAAEAQYRRLGRWSGADASPERQAESRRFWHESGRAGVCWLISRLGDEAHDDRLRGAASMLADLGVDVMDPILETLRGRPGTDQTLALLWALGWLGDQEESGDPRTELVLAQYLLDEHAEVREAAARAMRLIAPDRASLWLTRRLRDEPDHEVRRTIEEELESIGVIEAKSCIS
jgi:hypothetical protein